MIISRTPMRMSFSGGGSDFKEFYKHDYGSVVSTAINKFIYVMVSKSFTNLFWTSYSKSEYVDSIEKIEHNIVREALKIVGITEGVNISYHSDLLPGNEGSGLGASSSLAVGILNALYAFVGREVSAEILAKQACQIEIDILGHPMGKQDQYAAAFGGMNYIRFNSDETVTTDPIRLDIHSKSELNEKLLLFHTGFNSSSKEILPRQEEKISINMERLNRMVRFSKELRDDLNSNNIDTLGKLLHKGWMDKRKLSGSISNSIIDKYYSIAQRKGAIGGKVLGSGGGGFLLLFAEEQDHEGIRDGLKGLRECHFQFKECGSQIIFNDQG